MAFDIPLSTNSSFRVPWSDISGKTRYGARGNRHVLIIVSEEPLDHPDVVERKPAIQLTDEARGKLEHQGIPREEQCDDLTIVKARYGLAKDRDIYGVEMSGPGGERLTRECVYKQIASLMNNYTGNGGATLHYIGHGRRNTGDWCFEDGFITFKDLAELYLKIFHGHVLVIVSDCSHSGRWVKECMTFLDEQGVKPCGHSARDKGILIKVFTSCLSSQVPQQLAFSVHSCKNDKNTGDMMFEGYDSIKPMTTDAQHVIIHDFTKIRCSAATINDQCLCLPHANWSLWSKRERIQVVNDKDHSRETWHILLLSNDDSVILKFFEKSGEGAVNYNDYGDILKSGWGRGPSEEDERDAMSRYDIFDSVDGQ